MHRLLSAPRLILVIITLVLTGCAIDAQRDGARPTEYELLQRAQHAEQKGDYEAAAQEYTRLAAEASELKRPAYLLQAATLLVRGNHIEQARRLSDAIEAGKLSANQLAQHRIVAARIALADNNPQQALQLLQLEPPADASPDLRSDLHDLLAESYMRAGNPVDAARQHALREPFIDPADAQALDHNHQAIWQLLIRLPADTLAAVKTGPAPEVFGGWVHLARLAKDTQPADIGGQIAAWQSLYPAHPAAPEFTELLLARHQREARLPVRIALLLPLTGAVGELAEALRDGFLSAHFQRGDRSYDPAIHIYDVGSDPNTASQVLAQAVEDGSDFVVGPLIKQSVNLIARRNDVPVPTLTLNYSDEDNAPGDRLYQFGLAPEDEARQVSERAWLDGHNHALAIVPEGGWGDRVLQSFADDWRKRGGTLLEVQRYPVENNDFSAQIEPLLDLDESGRRRQALEKLLQQPLKFEPRRRQDADMVFMAAFPRQGRLIRPQLKFHYAGALPVYSTSHVYSGVRNQNADRDMDDVIFCDIPWVLGDSGNVLRDKAARLWPEKFQQYARFYALGVDAYNIIPHLDNMRLFRYEQFDGETGLLQLIGSNRIYRQLQWARFGNGLPRPYN